MQRRTVLVMTICAWVLPMRPAIAQTNSGFERTHTSFTSVRQYVADKTAPARLALPPNFIVPDNFCPGIESMLHDSATFRRQCLRIAGEPRLMIHLIFATPSTRSDVRAVTTITREHDGRRVAHIAITPRQDLVELIAHEFEHIVEQLDGVDLAAQAARPRTGVHAQSGPSEMFETVRATRVGLRVAGEMRGLP